MKRDPREVPPDSPTLEPMISGSKEHIEATAQLFTNLEKRRKRRESAGLVAANQTVEVERVGKSTQQAHCNTINTAPEKASSQTFTAGAKRKLSARDTEDRAGESKATDKDGFSFSRRKEIGPDNTNNKALGRKSSQESGVAKSKSGDKASTSSLTVSVNRKALGNSACFFLIFGVVANAV